MNQLSLRQAGRAMGVIALAVQAVLLAAPVAAQTAPAGTTTTDAQRVLPEVLVTADAIPAEAGAQTTLTQEDIEKTGATGMGDVIRYQPLVEAPGTVQGATRGASRYDRSGTTGYNIRGIEGNRIGLDVDGIEMPDAISRAPLTARSEDGTFGMGRDFIDPDSYSAVEIQSGTTTSQRTAGGIGGAVSFRTKSPEDYVNINKPFYAGARLGYSSANRAWTKGVTAAALTGDVGLLINYVRRDGEATRNNSSVESYPEDWHSDALLLKSTWRASMEHKFEFTADLYRKQDDSEFAAWNTTATAITGRSVQDATTSRDTLSVGHIWTPAGGGFIDSLATRVFHQETSMDDTTRTLTIATNTSVTETSQNFTRQTGFSTVASKRLDNHGLKFGMNYSQTNNEHPFWSTAAFAAGQPFPNTETKRTGLFIEDHIGFKVGGKSLTVVPGLRVDKIDPSISAAGFNSTAITPAQLEQMYGSAPSNTIVSPSLSLVYEIQPRLNAYAQWKRSGRAPTNSEIFGYWNSGGGTYALVGNRNLDKETSDAFDVGLKGTPTQGVTFSGSVFYTRYKDFISYTRYTRAANPELFVDIQPTLTVLYQANNRDEANIYGTEVSARLDHGVWTPAARGIYSTWAFGYSKGTSKSNYPGDKEVDLDTVQPAKAIVGVGYDAPEKAWGVNFIGTFVKGKQAVATNRQSFSNNPGVELTDSTVQLYRVPGWARFDLTGYYRVNRNTRLSVGIFNLFDRQYWNYSNTRNLQPANAQDRRQIALSTAPGRTFAINLNVDF
ncbi:TonB-dependent hemoglobin/transferrin/lactoferrin family receptor [Variovorax sp. VNK109]|jgi:hemoglobin/transferrin/lactoferrin receptor protein|uniref:TonB-dependent hemoglobin/transferrin/lactoferrin family receptor n=1 Tax=Variovorax sp. VNK109 TaxID=3400919 RepID=UPI003C009C51